MVVWFMKVLQGKRVYIFWESLLTIFISLEQASRSVSSHVIASHWIRIATIVTQLFLERCLTNGEKLMWQCRRLLWVRVVEWTTRCLSVVERNSTNKCICSLLCMLLNRSPNEPQSIKAKFLLPIMSMGIVAHTVTLCGTTFTFCGTTSLFKARQHM